MKTCKKSPHLCEHRIDKKLFTENVTVCENICEKFVKNSQNYRFFLKKFTG